MKSSKDKVTRLKAKKQFFYLQRSVLLSITFLLSLYAESNFPFLDLSTPHKKYTTKIVRVIDGDTLIDKKGRKIRLLGIDTPELPTEEGIKAKEFVEREILNRTVTIIYQKDYPIDPYNRILGLIFYNNDKKCLNKILLDKGLAKIMLFPQVKIIKKEYWRKEIRERPEEEKILSYWQIKKYPYQPEPLKTEKQTPQTENRIILIPIDPGKKYQMDFYVDINGKYYLRLRELQPSAERPSPF
ncbi:MAG: hypothetical protein DRI36_02235 [Caldiserica bacterium]|mgnify:CR=1 FL=1|nr:MAG: hypothetical protein DRI36_02235 [Caldisericota bacterium]